MISEDLLKIKIEERLKTYVDLPNLEIVRNSIKEEILKEIEENEKNN